VAENDGYRLYIDTTDDLSGYIGRDLIGVHRFDDFLEQGAGSADFGGDRVENQNGPPLVDPDPNPDPDPDPVTSVFAVDADTLALFEFDENTLDVSGNGRDAILLGGNFVSTGLGTGLAVQPGLVGEGQSQGIDWSAYAGLITHPFTVEMVIWPASPDCYQKLFGFDDDLDDGWYYCGGIVSYPLGSGVPDGTDPNLDLLLYFRHHLAFVSTSASTMDVYADGNLLGSTSTSIPVALSGAYFFGDDNATSRGEQLDATIDALRISSVARTESELQDVVDAIFEADPGDGVNEGEEEL
jgi:hypothetical protein